MKVTRGATESLKQKQGKSPKGRKTRATKTRLVWVLNLIGWEGGARFWSWHKAKSRQRKKKIPDNLRQSNEKLLYVKSARNSQDRLCRKCSMRRLKNNRGVPNGFKLQSQRDSLKFVISSNAFSMSYLSYLQCDWFPTRHNWFDGFCGAFTLQRLSLTGRTLSLREGWRE